MELAILEMRTPSRGTVGFQIHPWCKILASFSIKQIKNAQQACGHATQSEPKEIIRRYYIEDDLSLDQLVQKLASLGLTVTSSQLEYKLKKWKYRKNIDKKTWIFIDHRIKKRKRQGKESEVMHCGKRVKPETVKKETDRHRDTSIFTQLGLQPNATSPLPGNTDVMVCTPESLSTQVAWPETLPWLEFLAKQFQQLVRLTSFTIDSFLNQVFGMSLELLDEGFSGSTGIDNSAIVEIIRWLLVSRLNPDTHYTSANTALEVALRTGNLALAECLLDAGADVLTVSHDAWHDAVAESDCFRVAVVELLLHHTAHVSRSLALALALRFGNASLIQEELYDLAYRVERLYQTPPCTPLHMTFMCGYSFLNDPEHKCETMLICAGARLHGYEVTVAAKRQNRDLLVALLEAGGDANERDEMRWTALQCALARSPIGGRRGCACYLLVRHGGSLDDVDETGASILENLITTCQHPQITQWLEIRPLCYDAGALCASITTGNDALTQQLVRNRAAHSPSSDHLEVTALGLAAQFGKLDVLQELLERPPLTYIGPIPCHLGLCGVPLSPKAYSRCNISSAPLASPLALATRGTSLQAVECAHKLIRSGYPLDKLSWVAIGDSNNLALARALCNIGEGYENYKETIYTNPLSGAVKHQNKELVYLLIDMGVDVNEHNVDLPCNRSPLQLATELGDLDMVRLLLERGAETNVPAASHRGATALQLATIKGYMGIAMHLIGHGADVNAAPSRFCGRTVLEGAAEWGRIDMLELMLRRGALITGRWRWHYVRAVKLATGEGFHTAARLLKTAGDWSSEDQGILDTTEEKDWDENPWPMDADEGQGERN
ncbi:ankyrin repeat-containing domain protein [Xylariaceae sp. FL1272]|nr:ankyrin repeat-containing domain protein [Xylariaceae sp. FL1272]